MSSTQHRYFAKYGSTASICFDCRRALGGPAQIERKPGEPGFHFSQGRRAMSCEAAIPGRAFFNSSYRRSASRRSFPA